MGVSEPGRMSLPPPRELELPERDPVKAEVKDSLKQIIEAVVMRHFVEEQVSSRCHSLRATRHRRRFRCEWKSPVSAPENAIQALPDR